MMRMMRKHYRLDALERRTKLLVPAPLIIRCQMPGGMVTETTVDECITGGYEFIFTSPGAVVKGNNVSDFERILNYELHRENVDTAHFER